LCLRNIGKHTRKRYAPDVIFHLLKNTSARQSAGAFIAEIARCCINEYR
jgi:hypothetical protein